MKVKTSVSLSKGILDELDRVVGPGGRSEYIEQAVREALRAWRRAKRNAHDAAIYSEMAKNDRFQKESTETVEAFGVPWWELGDEIELTDEAEARIAHENSRRATG